MEEKSRLHFEGRHLLPLNNAVWRCHPWTQVLRLVGGCWNGEQQLVVRHLWCTYHLLSFLVWWPSPTCNHERYTPCHYWASTVRDSWLDVPWDIRRICLSPNFNSSNCYTKQKLALIRLMDPTPGPNIQITSHLTTMPNVIVDFDLITWDV